MLAVCFELWYETTMWGGFAFVAYLHLLYLQTTAGTIALLRYLINLTADYDIHTQFQYTFHLEVKLISLFRAQKYNNKRKLRGRLQHSMRIYSEIRILNTTYNNAFRGFVWPVYLTLPCCIFIGGMCTLLKEKSGNIIILGFSGCCTSITMGFLFHHQFLWQK